MLNEKAAEASRRVALGDLRFLVIGEIRRLLAEDKQAAERAVSAEFVSREQAQLIRRRSLDDAMAELAALGDAISETYPALLERVGAAKALAAKVRAIDAGHAMPALINQIIAVFGQPAQDAQASTVSITGDADGVIFAIGPVPQARPTADEDEFQNALASSGHAQHFLAAVSQMIGAARDAGRKLSGLEQFTRAAGYQTLEAGTPLSPAFRGIGVFGFRRYQTSLSLADPGEGHNLVTCLNAQLLAGTIVHVEHIDRGKETDREIVEPYRLPAPLNAARVRLQVGIAAPCTAYIGRTPFENGWLQDATANIPMARIFEEDLLKAAHMTASACSVMFATGIADCKIAMERMTVTQLIRFMAVIAGNVLRDRSRQFLSAAFNLNVPLLDDRDAKSPRWVHDKFEVARLGIEIAVAGGFEKVTWDGSSNLETSTPIIQSFTDAQWLELIHLAHEQGLETYVSAGMTQEHMPACVYAGVDGVGIGTSLHYRKKDANGRTIMGELKAEAILAVLQARDKAAASARGRGVTALAMLDRLHFERILPDQGEALRERLFTVLSASPPSDEAIEATLEQLEDLRLWNEMVAHKKASERVHPVIAQAQRRLIAAQARTQMQGGVAVAALEGEPDQVHLNNAIARGDITEIMEILR